MVSKDYFEDQFYKIVWGDMALGSWESFGRQDSALTSSD